MGYLPIFLDLTGRRCLIVGGGEVAERKVRALLEADARIRVVSPLLTSELRRMAAAGSIEYREREWQPQDLEDCALVFAATDDARLHEAIAAEARSRGIPINVADEPGLCDFIMPAIVRRGDVQIAVSTSGASPALASRIRRDLEAIFGEEYAMVAQILRAVRSYLLEHQRDAAARARVLRGLAHSDLAERVREADWIAVNNLLQDHVGAGLDRLGIRPRELSEHSRIA